VKAARHDLGPVALPDDWACNATEPDLDVVGGTLSEFIPSAAGPIVERDICLYTITLAGDLAGGVENEFVVDRLPQDPRIIVASPCSGHGAKFAVAIGEMLADLAMDSSSQPAQAFRIDRFSGFITSAT
jgi:sarcosine oxidase